MSTGIRPSSDKPVEEYYFQPWWVREFGAISEIATHADLSKLSDKDMGILRKTRDTLIELLGDPR